MVLNLQFPWIKSLRCFSFPKAASAAGSAPGLFLRSHGSTKLCRRRNERHQKMGEVASLQFFGFDIFWPECCFFFPFFFFRFGGGMLLSLKSKMRYLNAFVIFLNHRVPTFEITTIVSWRGVALSIGTLGTTNCCLGSGLDGGHWDITTGYGVIFHWTIWNMTMARKGKLVQRERNGKNTALTNRVWSVPGSMCFFLICWLRSALRMVWWTPTISAYWVSQWTWPWAAIKVGQVAVRMTCVLHILQDLPPAFSKEERRVPQFSQLPKKQ